MLTNCLAACAHLSITVSEIQRDICEKIGILSYPLHSTPPLGGFPSEYRHPLWYGKTRMVSLPDGEKNWKISLFVLAQLTNVMDGHTDGQTPGDSNSRAMHSIARQKSYLSVLKKVKNWSHIHIRTRINTKINHFIEDHPLLAHAYYVWSTSVSALVSHPAHRQSDDIFRQPWRWQSNNDLCLKRYSEFG